MNDRRVGRGLRDVILASPLFITAPLVRRRHLRWGATDDEVAGAMPGDEIVPKPSFSATRALSIAAPPEAVWPWLVQVGFGRAGFYSYDIFDNAARPSADRILPEYQDPRVGDWVPMASKVNETTAFEIKAFGPNSWLLWEKPNSTWSWKTDSPGQRRYEARHAAEAVQRLELARDGGRDGDPVRVRRLPDDAQDAPGREVAGRTSQRAVGERGKSGCRSWVHLRAMAVGTPRGGGRRHVA